MAITSPKQEKETPEGQEDKIAAYKDLLRFIDALWSVLLGLSLAIFFAAVCPLCIENRLQLLPKCLLLGITLFFFIDDAIEARILTVLNPYKTLSRFYVEVFIAILFFFAINLADKLSRLYFLIISLIFMMSILWSDMTVKEYGEEEAEPLHNLLKLTQCWASTAFIFLWYISLIYSTQLENWQIYGALFIFCLWYLLYDIFRELIIKDVDFKGTGLFPAKLIVKIFKFIHYQLKQKTYKKK